MSRCVRPSFGFISGIFAAIALAACGRPPAAPTEARAAQPASGDAAVVVPVAEADTSVSEADASTSEEADAPSVSALAGASALETCIWSLRSRAGGPGPVTAGDAIFYGAALQSQWDDDLEHARKMYRELIRQYPESGLVGIAHFNLGEMFRGVAKGDREKLGLAEKFYREAAKASSGAGSVRTIATYRLGKVLRASSPVEALSAFRKIVNADRDAATDGCAGDMAWVATKASAEVFAEVAEPAKCWSFYLSAYGGNGGRTAVACMEVADALVARKDGKGAAALLAGSVQAGVKAQRDGDMRGLYCERARAAAAAARAVGGAGAALDEALAAACD